MLYIEHIKGENTMKIFLRTDGGWHLFEGTKESLKNELDQRNILIGVNAEIGNYAKIGYNAEIGDSARIGNSAEIGYYAKIGYNAEIGDSARIGNSAEIGYYAKIGNSAEIGNYADISTQNIMSSTSVIAHLSVVPINGAVTLYKAVQANLLDHHSGTYQYVVGKGDKRSDLKPDQSVQCGEGWHFTNIQGAIKFAKGQPNSVIISATINVEDILAISYKVRVKAFSNVQLVELPAGIL
jgi:acetyltransferase-like isoleucine patch superfamily enzyme